jgi:hypothetical protein
MTRGRKRRGKRNRKKHEVRVSFPCPLAAILLTVATLSLAYLWLCGRCDAMGKDLTALEERKEEVRRRVLNEEFKWTNLKAPRSMRVLLQKHNLVMMLPGEEKVVRVKASVWDMHTMPDEAGLSQYAQQPGVFAND